MIHKFRQEIRVEQGKLEIYASKVGKKAYFALHFYFYLLAALSIFGTVIQKQRVINARCYKCKRKIEFSTSKYKDCGDTCFAEDLPA